MGILQNLQDQVASYAGATLTSTQEDGRVCFAVGILAFTPARMDPGGLAHYRLETRADHPLTCCFSDALRIDPVDTHESPSTGDGEPSLGNFQKIQRFSALAERALTISLSESQFAGLAMRIQLGDENPVKVRVTENADLYAGFGPSVLNGALASYVLALSDPGPQ